LVLGSKVDAFRDASGPNPVEQYLAALGNCLSVGYVAGLTMKGVKVNSVKIKLDGTVNA